MAKANWTVPHREAWAVGHEGAKRDPKMSG
ncbi:MAG: hypothetical protein QOK36_1710 [Gaiellales bacterium]|jgi:hypothetical protein|nr:hypothetical protein [Gaiellales bacterium]